MKVNCAHHELIKISDLNPNPQNPNRHSKKSIEQMAKILEYQGWRHPILVSKDTGMIVAGHKRLEAAKLNGWQTVPIEWQNFENTDQEQAHLIADNGCGQASEMDYTQVNDCLKDLDGMNFDIDWLGLDGFEVDVADKGVEVHSKEKCPTCGKISIESKKTKKVKKDASKKSVKAKAHGKKAKKRTVRKTN